MSVSRQIAVLAGPPVAIGNVIFLKNAAPWAHAGLRAVVAMTEVGQCGVARVGRARGFGGNGGTVGGIPRAAGVNQQ